MARSEREAIDELANVARNLLTRLREVDSTTPPMFLKAIENKIEFYASFSAE